MSLSHLLMVVVDDEKEMANPHRKHLQRSGFNSNTSFTDSLLTSSYYKRDHILHNISIGLQMLYLQCKKICKKIKRKRASKMNLIINIQCSKMMGLLIII